MTATALATDITPDQEEVALTAPITAEFGDLFRLDDEIVGFRCYVTPRTPPLLDPSQVFLVRGLARTARAAHDAGTALLGVAPAHVVGEDAAIPSPFASPSSGTPNLGAVADAGADAGGVTLTNLGAPSSPDDAARLTDLGIPRDQYLETATGDISATKTLTADTGAVNAYEDLTANGGDIDAHENLTADTGAIDAYENLTANGGDIDAHENLTASGAVNAYEDLTANGGDIDAHESLTASGAIDAYENLWAGTFIDAHENLTASGAIDAYENLTANGGDIDAHESLTAGNGGNADATSTAQVTGVGLNARQLITGSGVISGGTWDITSVPAGGTMVTAADIPWDVDAADLQTLVDPTSASVTVTGGPIASAPFQFDFIGALAGQWLSEMTVDATNLTGDIAQNSIQEVTGGGVISGGTWDLRLWGYSLHGDIPWDVTAGDLATLINIADIIVTGGPLASAPFDFEFAGEFAGTDQVELTVGATNLTGTDPTLTPSIVQPGHPALSLTPSVPIWGSGPGTAQVGVVALETNTYKTASLLAKADGTGAWLEAQDGVNSPSQGDVAAVDAAGHLELLPLCAFVTSSPVGGGCIGQLAFDSTPSTGGLYAWNKALPDYVKIGLATS